MVALRWVLCSVLATATVGAATANNEILAQVLARQAPGTPAYNCHDNCGNAILESKGNKDVCSDNIFVTDYKACLQCAGPDNQNIWTDYGPALTGAAAGCGLATTPASGQQPTVGPALHAPTGGGSTVTGPPPTSSPTAAAGNGTSTSATSAATHATVTSGARRRLGLGMGLIGVFAAGAGYMAIN